MEVESARKYEGAFPHYSQPLEIGCFSVDCDRNYVDDSCQLKYLAMPKRLSSLHMDLNEGYCNAVRKEFGKDEKLDIFLKWVISHQEDVKKYFVDSSSKPPKLKVNFVCYRGLLTSVSASIYESKEDWIVCATKFRNIIYLCNFHTEQRIQRELGLTERDKLMSAWGYKFEQYMTSDAINSRPNTSVPVNEKEEYCTVLKGRLQNHTILFSAEVDGEDPSYCNTAGSNPSSMNRYVEFKTSRIVYNERQNHTFLRYKLIKWWLQSFLAGIPRLICGFRDDNGIVRQLGDFQVRDMPRMAQGIWSPAACLNFCSEFLNFVTRHVVKDDPRVVYKFYWKPGSNITVEELPSPSKYQILPEWYIKDFTIS